MSLLSVDHLTVHFGGVAAVDDVSFDLRAGEMLGLMAKRHRGPLSTGTFVALAAGIAVAAGVSMSVMLTGDDDRVIRLAPVVATLPEPEPSPIATPAMVASMPAGMPIWPAVFVAQRVPLHLASDVAGR